MIILVWCLVIGAVGGLTAVSLVSINNSSKG